MEFILPNIGEGIETISISDILIKENQTVNANDIIMNVETDKATIEIPIEKRCIIKKIYISTGDLISPGQKILDYDLLDSDDVNDYKKESKQDILDTEDNKNKNSKSINVENENKDTIESKSGKLNVQEAVIETSNTVTHASPSTRKLAREMDIDLSKVKGTGSNNRITQDDILAFNKGIMNKKSVPENSLNNLSDSLSKWGLIEEIELNTIQKTSSRRLYNSWNTIPHVTQFDESDITELDKLILKLKKINKHRKTKPSYLPFFIKTVCKILKELTIFNTSFNTNTIIQKYYYNIGFAVDTPKGLVVPVIKNVDEKSIKKITIEFNSLVLKARENKLSIDDMSGGCLTISSLGNIGGNFFTPIINSPEVAILGISSHTIKPIYYNSKFIARKILPISLSYDHRVVNGVDAANFTKLFTKIISNPSKL